ncbi:MAG TPA: hypothetical protein VK582_14060 [Pyrinomonadaceae bacterium]|nr:hypothetical protein [Pyrinomonadaceae bacterium]
MAWPTPQDYNEAIQSPRLSFDDAELKGGVVETSPLGLPKVITGGFASVYRVKCKGRDLAVRCFLKEFADQQVRYEAIAKHVASAKLPYTVGFDFLSKGIRVRGQWYPILKMEWIQGELLNTYIRKHLTEPSAFQSLAGKWTAMMSALRLAGISHGDLQHGNIVVVNNELRLIDYDGMFVPALKAKFSNEVGHRNYQHPQRTEFNFGPGIDNFSAWVIYVSLIALSIDPELWIQLKAGDESLLFHREDFEEPFTSRALTLLSQHPDQRLGTLVTLFQSVLFRSPDQVPALDDRLAMDLIREPSGMSQDQVGTSARPDWLYGQEADKQEASERGSSQEIADPTWVLDWISPSTPDIAKAFTIEIYSGRRIVLALAVIGIVTVTANAIMLLLGTVSFGTLFMSAVVLVSAVFGSHILLQNLYSRDPVVGQMQKLEAKKNEERRNVDISQRLLKENEKKKASIRSLQARRQEEFNASQNKLRQQEQREKGEITARSNVALNSINKSRVIVNQEEAAAINVIKNRIGLEVAKLTQSITLMTTRESDEIGHALSVRQNSVLWDYLSRYTIDAAHIPGVGEKLKMRLRHAGIRTATDVEYWTVRRVDGIGDAKAISLLGWRQLLASRAPIPKSLSLQEVGNIQAKYVKTKRELENQRTEWQTRLDAEISAVRSEHEKRRDSLNGQQASAQERSNQWLNEITSRYGAKHQSLAEKHGRGTLESNEQCRALDDESVNLRKDVGEHQWQLAKAQRDLISYKDVSFEGYFRRLISVRS